MSKPRFYVWVFAPSQVRDGYLVGAYAADIEWRAELEFTAEDFDLLVAAEQLWQSIARIDDAPTFRGPGPDAPLSGELLDALEAKAKKALGLTPAVINAGVERMEDCLGRSDAYAAEQIYLAMERQRRKEARPN